MNKQFKLYLQDETIKTHLQDLPSTCTSMKYVLIGEEKDNENVKSRIKYVFNETRWDIWKYTKSESKPLDIECVKNVQEFNKCKVTGTEGIHLIVCSNAKNDLKKEELFLPTEKSRLKAITKKSIILIKNGNMTNEKMITSSLQLQKVSSENKFKSDILIMTYPRDSFNATILILSQFAAALMLLVKATQITRRKKM